MWLVCYLAVGLIPGLGFAVLTYLLHLNVGLVEDVFMFGNFIVGLILSNIIVAAGIGLAGAVANYIT